MPEVAAHGTKKIPNMPEELACGIKILNMPGVLTRGKKKVKVSICPGFWAAGRRR